ncbi:helix-turn-helix domain-containing protein [Acetobacter orientalis]|uniref:helix-turn-helix domain-containing protein n=1 Tax=Acetobacter orientalis TaxID=146474 RepID=UPI00241F4B20|nr:helix-turn-helix domain-containing protein [Acetobacter orientalis]
MRANCVLPEQRVAVTAPDDIELINAAIYADIAHSKKMNRGCLSDRDAGKLAKQVRLWHKHGKITSKAMALGEAMIWECRRHGARFLKASLTKLARDSGLARSSVARLLPSLEKLGLFRKTKVRFILPWCSGMASRQGSNVYELADPADICVSHTESDKKTVKIKPRLLSILLPQDWRELGECCRPPKPLSTHNVPSAAELQSAFEAQWHAQRRKKFSRGLLHPV